MRRQQSQGQIKLDLGVVHVRALRMRAGFDGVDPRDVVMAALDQYMPNEIEQTRAKLSETGKGETAPASGQQTRKRSRKDED